ncbi:hypothetical protein FCK90_05830 [Kocuria coralli]|uniref:Uncharacterized protein n=1 Tax=Kocuria coralli TaxID=1461025 RepID=A0A5J5KY39_9MICC|nr:hypothetical protein [Kocuria coralli]KAA9394687.1 hypothetical protein FCK90_05830 [Kocuria coralli]
MSETQTLALGQHRIARNEAETEYLKWNDAVCAAFYGEDKAGELVFLDLDEKALARIGEPYGLDGPATLRAIADSVTPLLVLDGSRTPVFETFTRLTTFWYRDSRRQLDTLSELAPPPIIALLALFALAGRHTSRLASQTGNKSASAFYLPLAVLLHAGQDNAKALESSFKKDTEAYWDALRYWLELRDGEVGLPVGDALNQRPVGLALTQSLLGDSERRQLHQMFADMQLTTAQGLSPEELGVYVDFWLDVADTDVSKSMRQIWSTSVTRYPGLEVARAELARWEKSRAEAGGPTPVTRSVSSKPGQHSASLALVDSMDYIGNTVFEFGFVVPKRFMMDREVELETTAGPRTLFLSYIGDAYLGISALTARIEPSSLLAGELKLSAGAHRFERTARPVVVFAKDAFSDTFISVDHIPAAWPCRVLVRDEEPMLAQMRSILNDSASPDYTFVPAGTAGLPEGWAMFDDVQVLRAGNPELTVNDNFSGLVPRLAPTVRLSGGLRIPGDVVRWSAQNPPQITVVSDSDDPLTLEVEWRHQETFRLQRHKLAEGVVPPFQISTGGTPMAAPAGGVKPNDYVLVLKAGRTVKQRVHYSVRDCSFYMTQRSLGYEGEMVHTGDDALWPVTAATVAELPDEYVQGAFNNLDPIEAPPAELSAVELPTVAGWHSAEGQLWVSRENELPEHEGPSCLATGKHRIVLPPMDPKAKAPWVFGRCRDCGLEKRYPGRLTKLSAVSEAGSVEALQFIGPEQGEHPTSWAPFRDVLTFLGGGKRSSLSIVARQLVDTERFEEWFVGHLLALGFLEVVRDENWMVRRWQVCSPALTQLVDGSILLTGGWTPDKETVVSEAAAAQGGALVTLSPEDHSSSLVQDVDLERLQEALPDGLCDVVYEAGPVMLDTLAPLSTVEAGLPRVEMQYNGVAERFEAGDATWRATTDREQPGMYRINHHHRTRYVFRTEADVESGHGRLVNSGLGKHLAARQAGRPLVSWDEELQLLSVPIGAELPGLYARATVLCSGVLPTRVDEDFSLNYGDITEDFARILVAKLMG